MKPLLPLLAALLAFAPGCGDDDGEDASGGEPAQYTAELRPLNESGVRGNALFELEDGAIGVKITARGLRGDQIIAQYVKGVAGTTPARCPDGDVSASQGRRAYGGTLLAVEPFPTVKRGEDRLRYDLRLSLSERERDRLEPFAGRALVLSGETAERHGDLRAGRPGNLPLACGLISRAD